MTTPAAQTPHDACPRCGYALCGLPTSVCPRCPAVISGTAYETEGRTEPGAIGVASGRPLATIWYANPSLVPKAVGGLLLAGVIVRMLWGWSLEWMAGPIPLLFLGEPAAGVAALLLLFTMPWLAFRHVARPTLMNAAIAVAAIGVWIAGGVISMQLYASWGC